MTCVDVIDAVTCLPARARSFEKQHPIARLNLGLIILDVLMPGEDGWELLMEFKANESTRDIPVVICSVFSEPQLARNLGAAAYLPKPVTQRALLRTLRPWSQVGATLAPTP